MPPAGYKPPRAFTQSPVLGRRDVDRYGMVLRLHTRTAEEEAAERAKKAAHYERLIAMKKRLFEEGAVPPKGEGGPILFCHGCKRRARLRVAFKERWRRVQYQDRRYGKKLHKRLCATCLAKWRETRAKDQIGPQ